MPLSDASTDADRAATGILTIDLDAVVANWRLLQARLTGGARCAAVVKADAYGLGIERVAPALAAAGCRSFFVAQMGEALTLRGLLPDAEIAVLAAPVAGAEGSYAEYRLLPVLNDLDSLAAWRAFGANRPDRPAILHVDTGMSRLGLSGAELERVIAEPDRLSGVTLAYVMSHLACADEAGHPLNAEQLGRFRDAVRRLPVRTPASFANSSGIFLGGDYHFDLARPGVALYGANPTPDTGNPMRPVVRLQARILQVREVDRPSTVGYGATQTVAPPTRLATLGVGYADGYLRSSSGGGSARIAGRTAPFVGRVSMDLIVVNVSDVAPGEAQPGALVDLIGPDHDVDAAAAAAGTIAYEMLTSLGSRYERRYIGGMSDKLTPP